MPCLATPPLSLASDWELQSLVHPVQIADTLAVDEVREDIVRELEVRFLARVLLDKHRQALQLAVLEIDEVRAHLVQERREMGDRQPAERAISPHMAV